MRTPLANAISQIDSSECSASAWDRSTIGRWMKCIYLLMNAGFRMLVVGENNGCDGKIRCARPRSVRDGSLPLRTSLWRHLAKTVGAVVLNCVSDTEWLSMSLVLRLGAVECCQNPTGPHTLGKLFWAAACMSWALWQVIRR